MSRRLAAASSACALGAATEPLDGRALTHRVDARAGGGGPPAPGGGGGGSNAAFLHRDTMGGILSVACGFKAFWWRNRGRSRKVGAGCGLWTGAAPLTAAGEAAGRGAEEGRRRRCCTAQLGRRKKLNGLGFFQGRPGLIYTTDLGGYDLSRRSGDRRRRCIGGCVG
jgi:hypothetical protein